MGGMARPDTEDREMTNEQYEALQRLADISDELADLGDEVKGIIKEFFPEERQWAEAYKIYWFGYSGNPYDNTLETLIRNIHDRDAEEQEEEF